MLCPAWRSYNRNYTVGDSAGSFLQKYLCCLPSSLDMSCRRIHRETPLSVLGKMQVDIPSPGGAGWAGGSW